VSLTKSPATFIAGLFYSPAKRLFSVSPIQTTIKLPNVFPKQLWFASFQLASDTPVV
jgi:hypothetical protein